jgi:hypothetical protein
VAIPDSTEPLPGLLAQRRRTAEICAYICTGIRCLPPIDDFDLLETSLSSGTSSLDE